jgi:hypothetical protein
LKLTDLPKLGAALAAGIFAGLITKPDGTHHAVVLLADKPDQRLPWQHAMEWAAGLQAELPTRPVAAMLFANLKPQFEEAWHWTSDEDPDDGSYAWGQSFGFGGQDYYHESYEGRARAVRLIQLEG